MRLAVFAPDDQRPARRRAAAAMPRFPPRAPGPRGDDAHPGKTSRNQGRNQN
ncbi:MAG: hypothetical protein LBF50_08255 [Azoarcus sp.]|nr:hypothetical protein [Azoarcus sp.]